LLAGISKSKKLPYAKNQKQIMDAALARDVKHSTELLEKHYENAVEVVAAYFEKNNFFEGETN
jgi:hypothetical protein